MKVRVISVVEVTTVEPTESELNIDNVSIFKREIKSYYDINGNLLFQIDKTAKYLNELLNNDS